MNPLDMKTLLPSPSGCIVTLSSLYLYLYITKTLCNKFTAHRWKGSKLVLIPCGLTSVMAKLGQSEAMLSAVAIRALCLQANGGH